jgi:hypothetical protein
MVYRVEVVRNYRDNRWPAKNPQSTNAEIEKINLLKINYHFSLIEHSKTNCINCKLIAFFPQKHANN